MKKTLFILFFALTILSAQAQSTVVKPDTLKSTINGKNELKVNLLSTLFSLPEINYERIIASDMSVGLAVMFRLDKENDINFGLVPNYRIYFGAKKAAVFFLEGNAALIRHDFYNYDELPYTYYPAGYIKEPEQVTNFGLGLAGGTKFLTKSGLVAEVYVGVGRVFGDKNELDTYPRVGISIGKRF